MNLHPRIHSNTELAIIQNLFKPTKSGPAGVLHTTLVAPFLDTSQSWGLRVTGSPYALPSSVLFVLPRIDLAQAPAVFRGIISRSVIDSRRTDFFIG